MQIWFANIDSERLPASGSIPCNAFARTLTEIASAGGAAVLSSHGATRLTLLTAAPRGRSGEQAAGTALTENTIRCLLGVGHSTQVALGAPGRAGLTYSVLRQHVQQTVVTLNAHGIGRNDRVALVLPNGPELASAFVGIAAGAAVAPLNPGYRDFDFHFYLSDLGARALVVERNSKSPAIAVAKTLRIPVLELVTSKDDPAGTFSVVGDPVGPAKADGFAGPGDVALVLHTSGTTSRPKMVPLSQRNLTTSAHHIVKTLNLSPEDCCLNIMPLFHIHGLMGGVLSSLAAGASVFCTPGFSVLEFFRWMSEAKPTWYTAVPTMHQAVLAHADQNRSILDQVHLRFIRSSSAALAPAVMRKLEQTFNAPVIESYGMTEAAHQMASNPLPPAVRKPGTVGLAAGPEIAIMDPNRELLPAGAAGEVVIRGLNVTSGYENNAEANAAAFANGWFRTGDQGVLDEDGYLTITGRLKEIINRGGEKVSPKEVDDALLDHPNVVSAAAFPIPHPTLGEEIGAVVVADQGTTLTEQALAHFLAARLAHYKIPRRFVFASEIPKGPTGKIQRHSLAAALGLSGVVDTLRATKHTDDRPPTPLEVKLKGLWERTLRLDSVGLHDNFFFLGGDSLQAVELLALVAEVLGHSLPQSVLIECGTIAEMAQRIEKNIPSGCVVPFRSAGSRPPFFCIHDLSGQVLNLRNLARHMGNDLPFYAIQAVGADDKQPPLTRIEDMATHYIREIRKYQSVGPYFLGGYSMGGLVAFEMTRQLLAKGENVAMLALIDAYSRQGRQRATIRQWVGGRWGEFSRLSAAEMGGFLARRLRNARGMILESIRHAVTTAKWHLSSVGGLGSTNVLRPQSVEQTNGKAVWSYRIQPLQCNAVLFKGKLHAWDHPDMHEGWKDLVRGNLEVCSIDSGHLEVMHEPFVHRLAAELTERLAATHPPHPTGGTDL